MAADDVKGLLTALAFLTRLPVPQVAPDEALLRRAAWWFPVVGLVLGGLNAVVAAAACRWLPPWPAALLVTVFLAGVSGAFHLDGLADTADGFFSSRPRERILEIMRDSHIGTMGVVALVLVLLGKVIFLAGLPAGLFWRAALLMPVAGRCALLPGMSWLPYARPEGLGARFWRGSGWRALWAIAVLAGAGWLTARWLGLATAGAVVVLTGIFAVWCRRRIGGGTGDTQGAVGELAETLVPLVLLLGSPGV